MTITNALKSGKIVNINCGKRWLYFGIDKSYGIEFNKFVVREYKGVTIIVTDNEEEAVGVLTGEDK